MPPSRRKETTNDAIQSRERFVIRIFLLVEGLSRPIHLHENDAPGTKDGSPYIKVDPATYFGKLDGLVKDSALSRSVADPGQPAGWILPFASWTGPFCISNELSALRCRRGPLELTRVSRPEAVALIVNRHVPKTGP